MTHLANHDGEDKNPNKVIDELKHNLKEGCGVRQAPNGDQSLHCKVIAADVAETHTRWKNATLHTWEDIFSSKSLTDSKPTLRQQPQYHIQTISHHGIFNQ